MSFRIDLWAETGVTQTGEVKRVRIFYINYIFMFTWCPIPIVVYILQNQLSCIYVLIVIIYIVIFCTY